MHMSALLDFLVENPVANETEQVEILPRLKGMPFTIGIMDSKQFNEYTQAATTFRKGKKVDFQSGKLNMQAVINHTVDPNFKDAEAIKKAGCVTPEQFLNKVLKAGEIANLAERIFALSGFNQNMDDAVDEAKNF
jgi:6-phosphogluconate dehydrogenase